MMKPITRTLAGLLRRSARAKAKPAGPAFEAFPVAQLDQLVHALYASGRLPELSAQQAHNILHALHLAGRFSYYADPSIITHNEDGLITLYKDVSFLAEPRFQEAFDAGRATGSWGDFSPRWRAYVLCWAAERALRLEGDFVECGVNRGGYSQAVMRYLNFATVPRRFYLLDTFCGFPPAQRHLAATCDLGRYEDCYEAVRATFREYPNAVIVRGAVPDTLGEVKSGRVAYLSIDMNCAEPEIAAAEFFWDRLAAGAVIVLDDYGCGPWYLRQKQAFDAFAQARGVRVLPLPTGQGLIFKP